MTKKIVFTMTVLVLLSVLTGAVKGDEISELKQQLDEQQKLILKMQQKLEQLEKAQKNQETKIEEQISKAVEQKQVDALPDSFKWVENLKISGDLRYRHESIDAESKGEWKKGQNRHRIRARIGLNAKVNDEWDLGFRFASGSSDPSSTNQTLDEGFSSKDIWIDLAYFGWHPQSIKNLNVYGGKVKNPFYNVGGNQLIWDGDLNPEGIATNYALSLSENDTLNFNAGGFWAEESSGGVDQSLWGAQGYLKHVFENKSYALGGVSYYNYGNFEGKTTLFDPQKGYGNTTVTLIADDPCTSCCNEKELGYAEDFDLLGFFGEYGFELSGMPVALFGDYVKNTAANSSDDTGWLLGFKLNRAKKPGSWEFAYDYRKLEKDAVVGVFSDSDFIGGGTDGKGHRFGFTYQLAKGLQTALTYFLNQKGPDDDDYRRLQADLNFKF